MVGAINGKLVHRSEFEGLKKKWYLEIHWVNIDIVLEMYVHCPDFAVRLKTSSKYVLSDCSCNYIYSR